MSLENGWIEPGDWIVAIERPGQSARIVRYYEYKGFSDDHPDCVYAHPITPGHRVLVNREVNILLKREDYRHATKEERASVITAHMTDDVPAYMHVKMVGGGGGKGTSP